MIGKLAWDKSDGVVSNSRLDDRFHFATIVLGIMDVESLHIEIGLALFFPEKDKSKMTSNF